MAEKNTKQYVKKAYLKYYLVVKDGYACEILDDIWSNYGFHLGKIMTRDNFFILPQGDFDCIVVSFYKNNNHSFKDNLQTVCNILKTYNFMPFGNDIYYTKINKSYMDSHSLAMSTAAIDTAVYDHIYVDIGGSIMHGMYLPKKKGVELCDNLWWFKDSKLVDVKNTMDYKKYAFSKPRKAFIPTYLEEFC